jgi:glycosyltransferase involved in cell wall biosynthesis
MKILFLTNKPPYPKKDGGSIATMGMIEAFATDSHQVTVLAMNTLKHHITPFEIPNKITSEIIFHLVEVPAQISKINAAYNLVSSRLPYNAERFISKKFRTKLKVLLQTNTFDVVQLEGLYLTPYIGTIKKHSKALIAYRSHNVEHEIWQRGIKQASGLKKIYLKILTSRLKRFEIDAMNSYDVLITITSRDKQKLDELGNAKPTLTIPAGINTLESPPKALSQKNDLFFIGALDWAPNQEALIWFFENCCKNITTACPKTIITIAGRNAPEWFQKKISRYNVNFVGEVESSYDFMSEHGIMIAPLLSGSGMRVKILEGMFLKKPIITTSIGCEGIDAKNNNEIIIADSVKAFTDKTVQLINDKELRRKLSDNSFKFAYKNYSNTELIKKLTAFYKKHI